MIGVQNAARPDRSQLSSAPRTALSTCTVMATRSDAAALEIAGPGRLGGHVFTLLEGGTGKPSQLAPGREARRWMRVTGDDTSRPVDADHLASRLRFNPDFAIKLADAITTGTTVIVTDQPAVRKPILDSTVFAN